MRSGMSAVPGYKMSSTSGLTAQALLIIRRERPALVATDHRPATAPANTAEDVTVMLRAASGGYMLPHRAADLLYYSHNPTLIDGPFKHLSVAVSRRNVHSSKSGYN
jgi:hypothetical protein